MGRRQFSLPHSDDPDIRNHLLVPEGTARKQLQEQITEGERLLSSPPNAPLDMLQVLNSLVSWNNFNKKLLEQIFANPRYLDLYRGIAADAFSYHGNSLEEEFTIKSKLWSQRLMYLQSLAKELLKKKTSVGTMVSVRRFPFGNIQSAAGSRPPQPEGDQVFIVHGRDHGLKETTARFIESLGLIPVILHEQANMGRTVIQKFVDHAKRVVFALVLLTPDDQGRLAGDANEPLRARARQNVVLELGYFLGALGSSRVCAIHSSSVQLPSDFAGVLYVPFDEGGAWKYQVAKEMRAAGIKVDMNKL